MIKNYVKLVLRNITRQKGSSFINMAGLSIGMASCIIILLFIQYEFSYENMHPDPERIYRVLTIDSALGTNNQRVGITMPALGPAIPEAFSEVESFLRYDNQGQVLLSYNDNPAVYAQNLHFTDSNFFDFFGFKLNRGIEENALQEPYTIVLTESLCKLIFGDSDALNKTIKSGQGYELTVTGIMPDPPPNTHLNFDAVQSVATNIAEAKANQPEGSNRPIWLESWNMIAMPTYIKLSKGSDSEGLNELLTQFCKDHNVSDNFSITLQPLQDVHLNSTDVIFDPVGNKGDLKNIYIFAAIALFVLVIACVNYMNLATAKSVKRAREVGMRKVVGSLRPQLILQFLGESFTITIFSLLLAIPLIEISLPFLNNLGGTAISLNLLHNHVLMIFLLGLLFIVGIISGLHPALVLSGFEPIVVLRGAFLSGKQGKLIRTILVVLQFTLSIALIGSTAIVQKQLHYIQNKDLGYNRDQVILFDMNDGGMIEKIDLLRDGLAQHSSFVKVANANNVPGRTFGRTGVRPEGAAEDDIWIMSQIGLSGDAIETLGMKIVQGKTFPPEVDPDNLSIMLNETAVKKLGWDNPLEKRLYFGEQDSVGVGIQGIVKDFHFIEMQQNIEPVIVFPLFRGPGNIVVARIAPGQVNAAMHHAEQVWQEVFPDYPLSYSFMDDEFNKIYMRDITTGKIVNIFSFLAIFIACLGLLGLVSFITTQRTKEIGIRKTMGASVSEIIKLLTFDFMKWVLLANFLAWPIIYFGMNKWLQNFAYRTQMSGWIFLGSSAIGITIALLTISFQTFRAANSNPVNALKCE